MRARRPLLLAGAAALALALGAGGWLWLRAERAAELNRRAEKAAERGLDWLRRLEIPLKDPGIPWIVSVIDRAHCQDIRLRKWVAERFVEFEGRSHPIYPALRGDALEARERFFEPFFQRWSKRANKADVIMGMAYGTYCDRVQLPDSLAEALFRADETGYGLTHQMLALEYMEHRGCLEADQKALLERLASRLAEEHARDEEFSDLWAERVAVLLYGGFGALVESAWIERLIAEQQASGAWSDPDFPERFYESPENPHTTVLAVWALSEWSRSCPLP